MYLVSKFLVLFFLSKIDCANILAAVPSPFYSHQLTYRPIWRELAKRGHKLTLITANPMESNENITQIDFSEAYQLFEEFGVKKLLMDKNAGFLSAFLYMFDLFDKLMQFQFTHPEVVKLMNSNEKFDVFMVEMMNPGWPALSHKFKVPLIQMTTIDVLPHLHASLGNAIHPAIFPMVGMGPAMERPLSFVNRLYATFAVIVDEIFSTFIMDILMNKYIRKFIAEDCQDISSVMRNNSLVIVNANPIFHPPRPITPMTINLNGGLQLSEPGILPKDIQKYLDDSKNGCIYFSFGTAVDNSIFTEEKMEILLRTFEELSPINILWKFNETIQAIPKNVQIRKWFPQQDVLRHENVKLFITQGGLHSLEEGIEHAVPMLGIPFLGDQMHNVHQMVKKKFGLQLNFDEINRESFKRTILELLNNPLYRNNVQKYSKIQRDRPMRPVDLAVYWIEYVVEHGTAHLRSPSADIPLYQYFFLDIILFVICVFILLYFILLILKKVIILLYRCIYPNNKFKSS